MTRPWVNARDSGHDPQEPRRAESRARVALTRVGVLVDLSR